MQNNIYKLYKDTLIIRKDISSNINYKEIEYKNIVNNIIFKDNVENISTETFKNYVNINNIILPFSLSYLGAYSFFNCKNLNYVDMSKTKVEKIRLGTFSRSNLKNITFPSTLKEIDVDAFSYNQFKNIEFPESLEIIRPYAFNNCKNLENIKLNINTTVDVNSFNNCKSMKVVEIYNNNKIHKIICNDGEYISNISSINNTFIIIKSFNNNDKKHIINLINKEGNYNYIINNTCLKNLNINNIVKDINIYNNLVDMIKKEEIDDIMLNDISVFNADLNKIQKYFNTHQVSNKLMNNINTFNHRKNIISLLDELGLYDDKENDFVPFIKILSNFDNVNYKYEIMKTLKLFEENMSIARKVKLSKSITINNYIELLNYFESIINKYRCKDIIVEIVNKYDTNILDVYKELKLLLNYNIKDKTLALKNKKM